VNYSTIIQQAKDTESKINSIVDVLSSMRKDYNKHDSDIINDARKDSRYGVKVLVAEYDRLVSEFDEFCKREV